MKKAFFPRGSGGGPVDEVDLMDAVDLPKGGVFRGGREAFTFVEVFAAMVFLAILVPAIVEALSIANRTSLVAERSSIAGELAENKLNEILLSSTGGATTAAQDTSGDFGTDWPGYRWEMNQGVWNQDTVNTMSELSVQVFYPLQGGERSVTLTTLVSGTAQNQ